MKIAFYNGSTGPINRFLKKLEKRRPDLFALIRETLEKVKNSPNLNDLKKQGWVERLPYLKAPIFEFRIPPKKPGGVTRLYFGYENNNPESIHILSAEEKKGTKKANKEKIKQAEIRYKEVCL